MDTMDSKERQLRFAAARLVMNEDYATISDYVLQVMSDALLQADPLNEVTLRAAALQREAVVTIISYVAQMAEPINEEQI